MNRNFITGIVITSLLTIVFLVIFYFSKINTKSIHAINVLPKNVVMALEINNATLQFKLLNQQLFWQQLTNNKTIGNANENLHYLDSLLEYEENFKLWKNNENMVVSFHAYANKSIDELVVVETRKKFEMSDISNWIYQTNKSRFMVSKRKFFNNIIYDFIDFKTQKKFSFAYKNKLFAISSNGQLIEETLLNIENEKAYETSRLDKLSFVKSLGNYNLFVNYKNIPAFLNVFINKSTCNSLQNISNMASWSAFGVDMNSNSFHLKGVTITDEVLFQYFDCFNNMQAQPQSIKTILPANTSYYFGINFSDENLFKQNLKEYFTVNKIDSRNFVRDSINKAKANINLYKNITETFGNEIAQINLSNAQLSMDSCEVLVIKLKDKNKLINELIKINNKDTLVSDTISNKTPNLFQINLQNYFDYTWGNVFLNIQANYALVYNDYLLICNNSITLNSFYTHQINGTLLNKNADYMSHQTELNTSANVEYFINNLNFAQQAENIIDETNLDDYKKNIGYVKKTQFISYQMSATNDRNYLTNIHISFNTNTNKNTELLWELSLDTILNTKPQIVYNSGTNQNAIMVQDVKHQVYLINNESKILFKIPIYGSIIGKIHEVDAFKNGKTQYLFNTNSQIYLIDETGKNMQGFPLWIPTGTNFPIQVFDYLNDKTYQIFTVGRYYKIWCYNIQAKLQTGFNPKNYYPNPIQNIQAFVFRNNLISYMINEKGKLNFYQLDGKQFSYFGLDSNMTYKYISHEIIDTNYIKFYYIDTTNQFKVKQFHTTLPIKNSVINGIKSVPIQSFIVNNITYFLTKNQNKVTIFNNMGFAIYSKTLTDTFNYQFDLIYKNSKVNISYLDSINGKLFFENVNNKPIEHFPLNSNYYYTFGHLMNDENYFVITANFDNKLFVYQIK